MAVKCLFAPGKLFRRRKGPKEDQAWGPTRTRAPRGTSMPPRNSESAFPPWPINSGSSSTVACRMDGLVGPRSDLMTALAQPSTMLDISTLSTLLLTCSTSFNSRIHACPAAAHCWNAQAVSHDRCIKGGTWSAAACCTNHTLMVAISCTRATHVA